MAISAKSIKAFAKKLGVDETKLKAAMEADTDVDVDVPDVEVFKVADGAKVFTAAELTTRDTQKYNEGTTTGVEMKVKEFKREQGIDFKGKDLKSLYEHAVANKEDATVVEKLRESVAVAEARAAAAEEKASGISRQSKLQAAVAPTNNGLTSAKVLALMQVDGYEFKEEGGAMVAYLNGNKVKDEKLQTDVSYTDVIKEYQKQNKMIGDVDANNTGKKGGGGPGSAPAGKPSQFTKASEVQKAFDEQYGSGASMGTMHDYSGHLQKVMKEMKEAGVELIMD